jgi:gamma-glutamylcyclotransferase (GGCT)/AIG2-like uncharacterized protein YtfP
VIDRIRLFVYGSMLDGERDHALLDGAESLGAARTEPLYTLVDLDAYAALLEGGRTSIVGELYVVDRKQRFRLDVAREWPALFQRVIVRIEGGEPAEAYAMRDDQARGKRRLPHGDWRKRFAPRELSEHARAPTPFGRPRRR